jgi:hypothetical protein
MVLPVSERFRGQIADEAYERAVAEAADGQEFRLLTETL